jgi:pSer/pThr/pTyr-binding forkhead associated (FHA) protein
MPFLEHDGVTRELTAGETMVGAGSQAGWRLQTINLAPRHFMVSVGADGQAVLSAYGTQPLEVNGTPLSGPHPLEHGDEIIAGAGIFVYLARLDAPGPRISVPVPVQTEPSTPPPASSVRVVAAPAVGSVAVPAPAAPSAPAPPGTPRTAGTTATARAYLVDLSTSLAYPLGDDIVGIGRDAVNQIVLKDAATSRFHADVRRAPTGAFVFRSMGTNGSALNDTPAGRTPRALADGDTIRIGGASLRFTTTLPPGARIVAPKDIAPGPRAQQPTPIYRSDEPNTVPPPVEPRAARRGRLMAITAVILVAVVVLAALWMLRGGHLIDLRR